MKTKVNTGILQKLLLVGFFVICSFTLFAQRFNGGLILGGNVSQLDGDGREGYHKFGFQGGAFVSLRLTPHSSLQLEMEYIQKGSRYNGDTLSNSDTTFLYRFHYLEIPLLYQFSFTKGLRWSIEAGPAMDVLLGSYAEINNLEAPPGSFSGLRPVTLAGILGVSAFITDHLKANFRFNYSLLSIWPENNYPATSRHILFETGQYNNVLELSLLWYFKPREY
jgi:hypothetical protein